MDEYIQEHVALKKWTEKSRQENESCLVVFREIVGNKPVSSLERKDLVDFLGKVARLPANMRKKPAYKDKTVLQILNMKAVEPMSPSTVNKYVSRVGALMIYCVRQGYIDRNPAEGLSLARNVSADEERNVYTSDDLKKLIGSLAGVKKDAPERFWVPLVGMYSAMRLNEICQLYVADVAEVDGIWCFDVNGDGDKRLKNLASKRMIPIHPKLLELGFIDYIEKLKIRGAVRLWERLPAGRDGYSHLFGKWYQRHNREHITQDKKKCFHSFRHTVADTLKQAGVAEGVIAEILGHSNDSITTGRYGKRFRPHVLLEALVKLSY
jgi:integrase